MIQNWVGSFIVGCVCSGLTGVAALAAQSPPIVPGYEQIIHTPNADTSGTGELLLGELNCTACHQTNSPRIDRKGAPDLRDAGSRITSQYIRAFLTDPHAIKPGSTMPDVLRDLDAQTKEQDIEALTHFVVSLGGPVIPAASPSNSQMVENGRKLFHSIGCVACHAPENRADTKIPSVPLPKLAMKTTVAKLTSFLMDPLKDRPSGRMPNLQLDHADAQSIALYLLRDQIDNPQSKGAKSARGSGVHYELYTSQPANAQLETILKMQPASHGTLADFSTDIAGLPKVDFAIHYSGVIAIKKAGRYRFFTSSDDGSCLYIDGKRIVDNDGVRPVSEKAGAIQLLAGEHPIDVTFFQAGNGFELHVSWQGPGIPKAPIPGNILFCTDVALQPLQSEPFALDQAKVQQGRELFQTLGCAACHQLEGLKAANTAKSLADLDPATTTGCLGAQIGKDAPKYDLRGDQIVAIQSALKEKATLAKPLAPDEQAHHAVAAMNCYACHNRNGVGGPAADRADYFMMVSQFDMGEEGRLPPRLTKVGAKLLPAAIEQIVFEGKLHVRPVLATRMPIFSRERLSGLAAAFEQADGPEPDATPPLTDRAANDGRKLVGTRGLGCVNCHGVADVKSLGMPSVNLSAVHARLRPGWFVKLLENPAKVNPATRMPSFWDHGDVALKDLAGGTMGGQIDAIWAYLSQGDRMALPAGLQSGGFELVPLDQPIVQRTSVEPGLFVQGKIGTRAIVVGYPELVSVGFDAGAVRLAVAWRGRFWDAGGQWDGRGGRSLGPLGTDILHMPDGPAFAVLAKPSDPWPKVLPDERNIGGQFKGYVLDKDERPAFHYILDDMLIEEQPIPLVEKKASLLRKFHLTSQQNVTGLYFVAASGEKIEQMRSPGLWTVGDKYSVRINAPGLQPIVRTDGPIQQLLIPVTFKDNQANFEVEVNW
jgi:mono/diheme cytochrome c family protein